MVYIPKKQKLAKAETKAEICTPLYRPAKPSDL